MIFNFADASAGGAARGPVFQWMARRYGLPVYAWWENQGSGGALDALWWSDSNASLISTNTLPDSAFHGESGTAFQPHEMVAMRGRWNDSRATFVGCKGGEMGADHGDLDAGTFVLDALGKRWFHDLGSDDYALPNYFSFTSSSTAIDRWDYYRMRSEGQNTLTINPSANADMVLGAVAPLIAYQSEPGGTGSFGIHDLTSVYSGMSKVWRGTRLMGARNQVLVQDEIQAGTGKTVWWFAHYTVPTTTVVIDPDGTSATLTQGAERLWCKIVSGGGTFQIMDAVPLATSPHPITTPQQNANTGCKKLAINLTNVTNTTLAVWFVPLATGDPIPATLPTITALNTWNIVAKNDAPTAVNGVATSNGENAVDIDLRSYVSDDSTTAEQMLFSVSAPINGTVVMLADGHTARFTPTPGYTGVPSFTFTTTDAGGDPNTVLAWDFDLPDSSTANTVPDVSGNGRDGTIDFAGAGTFSLSTTDKPASLTEQGARSIDLVENTTTAARVQRTLAATELDWNNDNWTVAGWFKRRDTTNDDIVWHISDGDGFGSNDELYLNCPAGSTTVRLQHFNALAAGFDVDIAQTGITTGTWHHFAVVRSGTSLSLYMDGALAGTLQIGNDGATGSLGTGDVINNGTLRFDRTGTLDVPNAIGGTGGVQIDCPINAGTIVFSGTNTFDGGVNVSSGALRITNSTALGDGVKTITLSNGTTGAPQLRLDGSSNPIELPETISYLTSSNSATTGAIMNEAGNNIVSGAITLAGGGDTKIFVNAGTLTLGGALDIIAGPGLTVGTTFTILNKSSAGAMSGTFAGKPNGSVFTASGRYWQINYAGGNGNDVALMLLSALDGWRYIHFGTFTNSGNAADLFDANGDGESNFMEYAAGQDPHAATTARPGIVRNGATIEFTYTRSDAALGDGTTFAVEWSDTLAPGSWSTAGVTEQILTADGTLQTVRASVAMGTGRRFLRLRFARP